MVDAKARRQIDALNKRIEALERDLGRLLYTLRNCGDMGTVAISIREEDWHSQPE